jgi:hypothetical protein
MDQKEPPPELVYLLKKLDERQQKEALALVDQQERELQLNGRADPAIIGLQDKDQAERFKIERERYIADYERATRMKAEMEQVRREALEQGIDPDKPKLSR